MTAKRFASEMIKWLERNEFPEGIIDITNELKNPEHNTDEAYDSIHCPDENGLLGYMRFASTLGGEVYWQFIYKLLTK